MYSGTGHSDPRATRTRIPAFPLCHLKLTAQKPTDPVFNREPRTWGDHLRRRRLLRGLRQKDIADQLGVDVVTVLNWERNKVEPLARLVPRIVRFLGYHPWRAPGSVADWLRTARRALGLTQRELGWRLRVDPATVPSWETGRHRPTGRLMVRLRAVLATATPRL